MRYVAGITLGLLAGVLVYMIAAMAFVSDPDSIGTGFVVVFFIGGWATSSWLMIRGTQTVWRVITRGSLMGAGLWLMIIPAGMIFAGRGVSGAAGASDAELAGATIGAGLVSIMTGGVAVFMAAVCLLTFAVAYFTGREMARETAAPTKPCPECAEIVQEAAQVCRHCRYRFVGGTATAS